MIKKLLLGILLGFMMLPAFAGTPNYIYLGEYVGSSGNKYIDYYDSTSIQTHENGVVSVAAKQLLENTGEIRYYVFVVNCPEHLYMWGRVINAYTPNPQISEHSDIRPIKIGTDGAAFERVLCSTQV